MCRSPGCEPGCKASGHMAPRQVGSCSASGVKEMSQQLSSPGGSGGTKGWNLAAAGNWSAMHTTATFR